MEKERIGFIGLGVMGRPMAENLIRSGFPLVAYNRSPGPVGELAAIGANAAATAAQVAAESDVIITMLPDTPDVEHVYFGSAGLIHHLRPGTLLIDMTTASPEIARKIHQAALHKGADSLDAPVSGGDIGARAGTLSIMAGGSGDSFERARPVFEALGKNVVHMGDAGAGQVTKACNQIVVALTIEAVGEALALAKKSGVDPAKVRDALLGGFAQSRVLDVHGLRSLEQRFEPGFRVRLHRKDLSIALRSAEHSGVSLPHTAQVFEMMNVLISRGLGDLDHSVLIAYLAE
jgi:2-hydroxy-3-oxopropionate reductase